jgi:hypothetical protein
MLRFTNESRETNVKTNKPIFYSTSIAGVIHKKCTSTKNKEPKI